MNVVPLKFRPTGGGEIMFCDDAGGFFKGDESFLDRYASEQLTSQDLAFLRGNGQAFGPCDLAEASFRYRWAKRFHIPSDLDYVILVPTLRCNLACAYCQVSRVNESAPGHDWTEETLAATLSWLDSLSAKRVKIEFQGGEPLLRLDVLEVVRNFARSRFEETSFVVCTNLQNVSSEAWDFLLAADTHISTSLDPTLALHQQHRTILSSATWQFTDNVRRAVREMPDRISALPTFDIDNLPSPDQVIETYRSFGFRSIFLRPVNHQGFARKRFKTKDAQSIWGEYLKSFITALVDYNWSSALPMEEYYFSHCLRRVIRSGHDGHVDLRNPNLVGTSYVVVDYDGSFYPTDEARMMSRLGQIDLRMGDVRSGMDHTVIDAINAEATNLFDPDCVHCPYQAFCGVDLIDDLSRYGRIDLPRHQTDFCRRHTAIFDLVFGLLYSDDPKVRHSMALWAGLEEIDRSLLKVLA